MSLLICPFLNSEDREYSDRPVEPGLRIEPSKTWAIHPKVSVLSRVSRYRPMETPSGGVRLMANKPTDIWFYQGGLEVTESHIEVELKNAGMPDLDYFRKQDPSLMVKK